MTIILLNRLVLLLWSLPSNNKNFQIVWSLSLNIPTHIKSLQSFTFFTIKHCYDFFHIDLILIDFSSYRLSLFVNLGLFLCLLVYLELVLRIIVIACCSMFFKKIHAFIVVFRYVFILTHVEIVTLLKIKVFVTLLEHARNVNIMWNLIFLLIFKINIKIKLKE